MSLDEIKIKLEKSLTPKRFNHSVGVMETSVKLAERNGCDIYKAAVAGLLHDCARDIRGSLLFERCNALGVIVDEVSRHQPELLHGRLGAKLAEIEYGITDHEIKNAIRFHTTGACDMNILAKVIFIADYIEPGRSFKGVEKIRNEAFIDINRALLMAFDSTIAHVIGKGALLHPATIDARNSIIMETLRKADESVKDNE